MKDECKVTATSESLGMDGAKEDTHREWGRAMGPGHVLHGSLLMIPVKNVFGASLLMCSTLVSDTERRRECQWFIFFLPSLSFS